MRIDRYNTSLVNLLTIGCSRLRVFPVLLVVLLWLSFAETLSAAATYSVSIGGVPRLNPPTFDNEPTPVTDSATHEDDFVRYQANAYAQPGSVGVSAYAQQKMNINGTHHGVSAFASTSIDDLTILGPPSELVPVAMNLDLLGNMSLVPSNGGGPSFNFVSGSVSIEIRLDGDVRSGTYSKNVSSSGVEEFRTGILSNITNVGEDLLSVPLNQYQTLTPLSLSISVSVGAGAPQTPGGFADVNFLNTFELPTDRPVFVLPEGYSASSESWGIVDNFFVGVVPEPGGAWLLGSAFGVVFARRRGGR
ncbi:MAG: hypothetical protein ACYTGQ_13160 [Planctomycetota bacterium]|jgi:hypothetical protein